jgi:DNA-directed RNA polymerase sigma subunit (sigma70/sigma32)
MMDSFLEKLIKLAQDKDWEDELDERGKRDRDLIKIIQSHPEGSLRHNEAFKKLHRDYKAVIAKQAVKSQLATVMPSKEHAELQGLAMLKDVVKKFDLNKKNKPITYIQDNIYRLMQKEKDNHVDFTAGKSAELTYKTGIINQAIPLLKGELNREPNDDEIHDFIKNTMGYTSVTKGNIKTIKNQSRKDFSSDRTIGSSDSGAEQLTWSDIHDVEEGTAISYRHEQAMKKRIEKYLDKFNRQERTLIRRYFALGQFSNSEAKNLHEAASNTGMTNYAAQKVIKRLKVMAKADYPADF